MRNPCSRVLVVDDDSALRMMLRECLEQEGLEVQEAANGAEGLEKFANWRPDLVVLDVIMDDVDGFAVCEILRSTRSGRHVPIIVLTGLNDVESIRIAYHAGATDFATKPVNSMILSQRIRYMLRYSGLMEDLRDSQMRLARAQGLAHLGDWEWEADRRMMSFSDVACQILGIDGAERERSLEWYTRRVPEGDRKRVEDALVRTTVAREPINLEHPMIRDDGTVYYVRLEAGYVADEHTDTGWVAGTLQDISERKAAQAKIIGLAYYDQLTGLPNRFFFQNLLRLVLGGPRLYGGLVGVIAIGLEGLSRITDSWGEPAADGLVREWVGRIRRAIRSGEGLLGSRIPEEAVANLGERNDIMVRLNQDEFAILLLGIRNRGDAVVVARRLSNLMNLPLQWHGNQVVLSGNIGISVFPDDARDADALLQNACVSMRYVRGSPDDNIAIYSSDVDREVRDRLEAEVALRRGIERGELLVYYQPKISTCDDLAVGFEALVRWRRSEHEIVSPEVFIALAEETGLILPLGQQVLRMACRQGGQWLAEGLTFSSVAVNIAPSQFRHEAFVESVRAALTEGGLPPERLELEITERTLIEDTAGSQRVLEQLTALGVRVTLDDFGTGYSSLSYLDRFPLVCLKIDRSFIAALLEESKTRAIVQCVITLAHDLGLAVVAEGVETPDQRDLLRAWRCDFLQGYLFSAPVVAAQARAWMVGPGARDQPALIASTMRS